MSFLGMKPEYLPAFGSRLLSRLKVPAARQADFVNTLADVPFFDSQQIMSYDVRSGKIKKDLMRKKATEFLRFLF